MVKLYDILKAEKTGLSASLFTAMLGKKLLKPVETVKELEDAPPLSFTANGEPLIDWNIAGASSGVGDKTSNLFDISILENGYHLDPTTGLPVERSSNDRVATITPIDVSDLSSVCLSFSDIAGGTIFMYSTFDDSDTLLTRVTGKSSGASFDVSGAAKLYIAFYGNSAVTTDNLTNIMLNAGSIAESYEPYGYKIPVTCGGETNTIYIDKPLGVSDSISMTDTGISIPTIDGSNTLSVGTTVQPSSVYIKYKE